MFDLITGLLAKVNPPSNAVTEGLSPKVTLPVALLVVAAAILILAGVLSRDGSLIGYGLTVLGAAGLTTGVGAAAGPGSVVVAAPVVGTPSDLALTETGATDRLSSIDPGTTALDRRA